MKTETMIKLLGWSTLAYFWLDYTSFFFSTILNALRPNQEEEKQE